VTEFKESGGKVIHLTMYGIPVDEAVKEICGHDDLMIAVGAEKVPSELYDMADWNVSVGSQPHSEVAALAIVMDRLMKGRELDLQFEGDIKIIPSQRSKDVIETGTGNKPSHKKRSSCRDDAEREQAGCLEGDLPDPWIGQEL
jgi:tRNA (cytidine56-2'-O)-methyltransferase